MKMITNFKLFENDEDDDYLENLYDRIPEDYPLYNDGDYLEYDDGDNSLVVRHTGNQFVVETDDGKEYFYCHEYEKCSDYIINWFEKNVDLDDEDYY